jgi:hypothetical protein
MTKLRRYQWAAVALVLGSAVARLPLEDAITQDFRTRELLPLPLETGLRDKLPQESFVAVVGGLRSLIASYYESVAFSGFSQTPPRWDVVTKYYSLCCILQPRVWHYWEMHTWMLATNASEFYGSEGGSVKGLEAPMRKFYREKGLEICLKGISHNPEKYRGYRQAADLLMNPHPVLNPNPDHAAAAELYLKASECEDAKRPPAYATRFLYRNYLYELSRAPGRAAEAYPKLRKLYESSPSEDFPTTRTLLTAYEKSVGMPLMLRCVLRPQKDSSAAKVNAELFGRPRGS